MQEYVVMSKTEYRDLILSLSRARDEIYAVRNFTGDSYGLNEIERHLECMSEILLDNDIEKD